MNLHHIINTVLTCTTFGIAVASVGSFVGLPLLMQLPVTVALCMSYTGIIQAILEKKQ